MVAAVRGGRVSVRGWLGLERRTRAGAEGSGQREGALAACRDRWCGIHGGGAHRKGRGGEVHRHDWGKISPDTWGHMRERWRWHVGHTSHSQCGSLASQIRTTGPTREEKKKLMFLYPCFNEHRSRTKTGKILRSIKKI
jgi:hypothetical protein